MIKLKNRKLKLVLLVLSTALSSDYLAQDKSDTLIWLKEKIEKNMLPFSDQHTDIKLDSINECMLFFSYNFKSERFQSKLPMTIKTLKDVGGFVPLDHHEKGFKYKNKVIVTTNLITNKSYSHNYFASVKIQIPNSEPELAFQIEQAMHYLGSVCEQKEK